MTNDNFENSNTHRVSEEASFSSQEDSLAEEKETNTAVTNSAWHLAFQQTGDISSESFTLSVMENGNGGGEESEVLQRLHAQVQNNSRMMQQEAKRMQQVYPTHQSTTITTTDNIITSASTLDNNKELPIPNPATAAVRSESSASSTTKIPIPPNLRRNNNGPTEPGAVAVGVQHQTHQAGNEEPMAEENPNEPSSSHHMVNAELVTEQEDHHHVAATSAVPVEEGDLPLSQRGFRSILKDRRVSGLVCLCIILGIAGLATGLSFLFLQNDKGNDLALTSSPTASPPPTASPTSRLPSLQTILGKYVDDLAPWEMTNTTQYQALQWLANQDTWRPSHAESAERQLVERYAMMVLYFSLDGPNWSEESNFLDPTWDICDWKVDFCSIFSKKCEPFGVQCSGKFVTGFTVDDISAVGTLPTELGLFSSLQKLDIQNNTGIVGTIPKELLRIPTLDSLTLSATSITGTLPSEILSAQRLVWVDLHINDMHGPIDNIANPRLEGFAISENQFTGTIPESLGELTNADYIELGGNLLSGTLPRSLSKIGARLKYLSVYNNVNLTGTVPSTYYNLLELETLYIYFTNLTGIEGPFCGTGTLTEGYDEFFADCRGPNPKVSCRCCTHCCDDEAEVCLPKT